MELQGSTFGVIDYCSFVAVLSISLGIGIYTSFKGNKSTEDFLMGNRAFGPLPVAMSLLTSFVSAISLLGFSGESYAYGTQLSLFVATSVVGIGAAAVVILPVFYPLKLTSINEYLELRFKSSLLCKSVTSIVILQGFVYMGICLYAPTIALATVTPLTSLSYIFILGIVVTIYSAIGGIRAVIWTDVFQLTVMMSGLIIIFIIGIIEAGGLVNVWNTAQMGGRLNLTNFNGSIYDRHTFHNTLAFGFFLCFSFYGVTQINVQRMCAVKSIQDSRRVMWITAFGMILIYTLIFSHGIIAYVAYEGCDPMSRGIIKKKEEILPHFIVDRLSYAVGLPGLFVATVIGGALSSVSSFINAIVALVWSDYCSHLRIFSNMEQTRKAVVNKILSLIVGVLLIGTAILASNAKSLQDVNAMIAAIMYSGVLGVFLLGLLFPKTNVKGAWCGFFVSVIFMTWLNVGAFMYGRTPTALPFSKEKCPKVAISDVIEAKEISYQSDSTEAPVAGPTSHDDDFPLRYLYDTSYTLFLAFGTTVCVFTGLIASCLTGNQELKEVDPKCITPFVRKFYWEKKELEIYAMKENTTIQNGLQQNAQNVP